MPKQIQNKELLQKIVLCIKGIRKTKSITLEAFYFDTGIHLARIEQGKQNITISTLSKYIYTFGYITFPFLLITKIPFGNSGYNPKIIISVFLLIWTNDTFAYIVGKTIGKRKLFESVSPKKTIEGFLGGILSATVVGYIISKYYIEIKDSNIYIWIIMALIVGIFGTIGDLIESKFKRIAGAKDSGKIMPGHGGFLDRFDSLLVATTVCWLVLYLVY